MNHLSSTCNTHLLTKSQHIIWYPYNESKGKGTKGRERGTGTAQSTVALYTVLTVSEYIHREHSVFLVEKIVDDARSFTHTRKANTQPNIPLNGHKTYIS